MDLTLPPLWRVILSSNAAQISVRSPSRFVLASGMFYNLDAVSGATRD